MNMFDIPFTKILFIISVIVVVISIFTYEKWSYKAWEKRCEINAKHPDWEPFCHRNFFEEDPQWFIDNGYGKYVKGYKKHDGK